MSSEKVGLEEVEAAVSVVIGGGCAHASIQTTEQYLGSEQELAVAVSDNLAL